MRNMLILAALLLASTTCMKLDHMAAAFPTGRVTLQSDTGKYMALCPGCITGTAPEAVTADGTNQLAENAIWTLFTIGDKVAFFGSNKKYLARCNGCFGAGATTMDAVFVHRPLVDSSIALFTPVDLGNNKWAFKGDNGKFLTKCPGCSKVGNATDYVSLSGTDSTQAASQWTVLEAFPTSGYISLKCNYQGKYFERCTTCPNISSIMAENLNSTAKWRVQVVGDQIALRDDGAYAAAVCNACWPAADQPVSKDAVWSYFGVVGPAALWKPVNLKNGFWGLQNSATQRYLTLCTDCVKNWPVRNTVFTHVANPLSGTWSQWKVTPVCI